MANNYVGSAGYWSVNIDKSVGNDFFDHINFTLEALAVINFA